MKNRYVSFFVGITLLLGLSLLNHWVFQTWLSISYLQWYLGKGSVIAVSTTVVSLAWGDINKHTGLISAHAFAYLGASLQLVGLPIFALGTHLRTDADNPKPIFSFDLLITIPLVLALAVGLLIWFLTIVPLQYFVYLVCGAPARFFARSSRQAIAQIDGVRIEVAEIKADEKIPQGWWNASLGQKPVALTNLLVAPFFVLLTWMIG